MRRWYIAVAVAGIAGLYGCSDQPLETSCCHLLTSIEISPPSGTVAVDGTMQFSATVRDENDAIVETVIAWDVQEVDDDEETHGDVSSSGLFTASSVGSVYVTSSVGVLVDSALVTITP